MMAKPEDLDMEALEALQIIECPVCMEILSSPVFQCPNGHLICSSCLDRVNICPTCRKAMPRERIRNLAVEKLVSVKCPNYVLGCQTTVNRREKEDHILNCEYRSRDYCCLIQLEKVAINCNKKISKSELPWHMKDEHKLAVIENNEVVISQELDIRNLLYPRKWFPVVLSSFDQHFFLDCELIPDQSGSGARISWKCISAGSNSMAQQFSVKMTLFPAFQSVSLQWKGKVISIDQLQEKNLIFFSLTTNSLKEYTLGKNSKTLGWKMNIVIQRNSSESTCFQNPFAPVINMTSVELLPSVVPIIEGKYEFFSGDQTGWAEIIYYRFGSIWTRKVKFYCEYSFTFGNEVAYNMGNLSIKSTIINIENRKLIHREKHWANTVLVRDRTMVEDFSSNKMLVEVVDVIYKEKEPYDRKSYRCVYRKVNGW